MKKILTLFCAAAALLTSCKYDDNDLWNTVNDLEKRLKDLEAKVTQTNNEITSLSNIVAALENANWITAVTPLPDDEGYVITFKNGDPITIKNGQAGNAPEIGVTEIEGVYYWTLDGEPIQDDEGNNLIVSGHDAIAPQVRINETTLEWEISSDGGKTWESTGVVAAGTSGGGESLFSAVDTTNPDYVTFRLTDGSSFSVPRYTAPSLAFPDLTGDVFLFKADGSTYKISYTGSNTVSRVGISSQIPSGWDVTVNQNSGEIEVLSTAGGEIDILVVATAADGSNAMYWITLRSSVPVAPSGLQSAIDLANDGDVIYLTSGTANLSSPIRVDKAVTIIGDENSESKFSVVGADIPAFLISAGATLDGLYIIKPDTTKADIIEVIAPGATVKNSHIQGPQESFNSDYLVHVRAFFVNNGTTFTFHNNTVEWVTNPSYLEGPVTVTDNVFKNVRGFVVMNDYDIVMTGNSASAADGCVCLLSVGPNDGHETDLSKYTHARMRQLRTQNNNARVLNVVPGGLNIEEDGTETHTLIP